VGYGGAGVATCGTTTPQDTTGAYAVYNDTAQEIDFCSFTGATPSTPITPTINVKITPAGIVSAGGSASRVACWKSDGKSLGYATVAEITAGTCH
jgi:hypothetical protein